MTSRPSAMLLPIGNELLTGRTQDTNTPYAAAALTQRGIEVKRILTLPDDLAILAREIREAAASHDLVLTSGGIGATPDDLTREAVAQAFGRPLVRHPEALAMLGPPAPGYTSEARLRMADLPEGCRLIPNPLTRAPGFIVEQCYVLPGVPELFRVMFDATAPQFPGAPIHFAELGTAHHEGEYADLMQEATIRFPEVNIGSYPRLYYTDIACLLTFSGPTLEGVETARRWFQEQLDALPPPPPRRPRHAPSPPASSPAAD